MTARERIARVIDYPIVGWLCVRMACTLIVHVRSWRSLRLIAATVRMTWGIGIWSRRAARDTIARFRQPLSGDALRNMATHMLGLQPQPGETDSQLRERCVAVMRSPPGARP